VIRDLSADGSTAADYLNGPGIDNKLRQTTATGTAFYFLQDHLGSTRALTDTTGNVLEQQQYDSFGYSAGSALTRYGYTGRERDSDAGLIYYRARWYDPQLGRFISEDPIGFGGLDVNFYAYVKNQPLLFRDPSGLRRCHPLLGAILGGVAGAGVGAGGGAVLGAVAGGVIGAAGGTLVIPGFGTIGGGVGGVGVGAGAGAFFGSAIGAGIGIGFGINYCIADDVCDDTDTKPWPPNPPQDNDRDNRCNRQLYGIDYPTCDAVGRARGPAAYAKCIASAHQRYAACLRGLPLPPLDTWNN